MGLCARVCVCVCVRVCVCVFLRVVSVRRVSVCVVLCVLRAELDLSRCALYKNFSIIIIINLFIPSCSFSFQVVIEDFLFLLNQLFLSQ